MPGSASAGRPFFPLRFCRCSSFNRSYLARWSLLRTAEIFASVSCATPRRACASWRRWPVLWLRRLSSHTVASARIERIFSTWPSFSWSCLVRVVSLCAARIAGEAGVLGDRCVVSLVWASRVEVVRVDARRKKRNCFMLRDLGGWPAAGIWDRGG